jgi:diadenosine tetraphosphate (Ap4A) HIT family hydrolase
LAISQGSSSGLAPDFPACYEDGMPTLIHRRVEEARRGENPYVIKRLPSGWAVIGDVQLVKGYCLLLPDPVVPNLNALKGVARTQYLEDMTRLGDAILAVTGAARINYEILGNVEAALHAHCFPRYPDQEDPELAKQPVWFYDWKKAPPFDPARDRALMDAIAIRLDSPV